MRRSALAPCCLLMLALLAPRDAASAPDWPPVEPGAAKTFLRSVRATAPAAEQTAEAIWPRIVPHLGPRGVLHAVDTIGLDDESTATKTSTWLTAQTAAAARFAITLLVIDSADARCGPEDCVIAASHFATHLALRRDPQGAIRVVGAFETNSLVGAGRASDIASARQAWLNAIAARYPSASPALPPVAPRSPNAQAAQAAEGLNSAGIRRFKAKDYARAIALLRQAVVTDPAHLLARYNLACALSRHGRQAAARAVLQSFKDAPDCPGCQVRLVRARTDRDFADQRADPAFQAIVTGARLPAVDAQAAAAQVDAFFTGKAASLRAVVHPRRQVNLHLTHSATTETVSRSVPGGQLGDALRALRGPADARVGLIGMEAMVCEGACCRDTEAGLLHRSVFLDRVCVRTDAAGWTYVERIDLTDGD